MSASNYFKGPFDGIPLDQQVTNPNIQVGRCSYYSGYYHGHSFDDCALYLRTGKEDSEALAKHESFDKLIIGSFCSIATGVKFMMAGNQGHRHDWISTYPFYYSGIPWTKDAQDGIRVVGDTVVGHDVWIGAEAMIMPGVQIGNGAVIGARALVTKSVEPYTIVGGSPAKTIKKRFSEKNIEMLLEMQWWNWSEEQLEGAMSLMCSENVEGLYQYWEALNKESSPSS